MRETLTRQEKENLLITRATRLRVFAEKLGDQGRYLINSEAYLILEVFESRPRAIWRYIRYALRTWRGSLWFRINFGPRVWWYRRVKGLDYDAAIELACAVIEDRIFPPAKGGAQ